MMLRKASTSSVVSSAIRQQQRSLVTAAQKRALNKSQLTGDKAAATATAVKPEAVEAAPTGGGGAAIKPASTGGAGNGGGGGGGSILPFVGLAAVGGMGAAYYYDMLPFSLDDIEIPGMKKEVADLVQVAKEETTPVAAVEPEPVKEEAPVAVAEPVVEKTEGNRVTTISFPPADPNRPPQTIPPVVHDPNGSRVDIEWFYNNYMIDVNIGEEERAEEEEKAAAKQAAAAASPVETEVVATPTPSMDISPDMQPSPVEQELAVAHKKLRANLNETFLADLDSLSLGELKIRVVQLVSEMEERTKWEAVRLKEFLSMKEKEVAETYLEAMQKQRHEFTDLLSNRLREQEDILTRTYNANLQSKEDGIQSVLQASLEAQQQEHESELSSTISKVTAELDAKYKEEYGNELIKEKEGFVNELQEKVDMISELVGRIQNMEKALEVSREFESGSQRAHRISAAALAFVEKLEGSKGSVLEFAALKACAGEDGVIAAALSKISSSAVQKGVPTLSELQAKFESVHSVSREAALVPKGRIGLEGQLLGILFAKLTIPPSPDAAPITTDTTSAPATDDADYILAKAQKHVQLGNLELAVDELEKLNGQTAFTVKDWKKDALNRISVEKALKVIKMECALLNENMSGGGSSA